MLEGKLVSNLPRDDGSRGGEKYVVALLVVCWLRLSLPSGILVAEVGRARVSLPGGGGASSSLAGYSSIALTLLGVGLALLIVLRHWRAVVPNPLLLAAFVGPAVALGASDLENYGALAATFFVYPALGVAFWMARPRVDALWVIGCASSVIAASSIVGGLVAPSYALMPDEGSIKVGIFDGLLAGPFTHSNTLGMVLALGLPFTLVRGSRLMRLLCFGVVFGALVWTGSRTSGFAGLAGVLALALGRTRPCAVGEPEASLHPTMKAAVALLAGVVCLSAITPFVVVDPDAFTHRGRIWLASRDAWLNAPLLGHGSAWFESSMTAVNDLGRWAFHGHNLVVHTLVTGGAIGLVALGFLWLVVAGRAIAMMRSGWVEGIWFMVTASVVIWLEGAFRPATVEGLALWVPMAVLLFAPEPPVDIDLATAPERVSGTPVHRPPGRVTVRRATST